MNRNRRLIATCVACLGVLSVSAAAYGQSAIEGVDPRIDPATGRELAHWPPSPWFDFRHMRLEIDVPDMQHARFTAVETLRVAGLGKPRPSLRLDAGPGITVRRTLRDGAEAAFRRTDGELWIDFASPIAHGEEAQITIEYDCDFSANRGKGLTWSKGRADAPGATEQFPQIHSQGESENNRLWIPCHDFPNVKLTTELLVTVEDGYQVVSNGRLVQRTVDPSGTGRVTWHWHQDLPHASYLVTLVVGKFAVVDVGGPHTARPGLPMSVYTPHGTEDRVVERFHRTPDMVAYFEAKFDEPYPWTKYDQVICRDFIWGGMENTSATTLTTGAVRDSDPDQDDLIAHELGHQWFGDLITCKSWEHLWLNEGWASMCEALWNEQKANVSAGGRRLERPAAPTGPGAQTGSDAASDGADPAVDLIRPGEGGADLGATADSVIAPPTDAGRRAYQRSMLRFLRTQRASNRGYAPVYPSLVSNRYSDAEQAIMKADDVYSKGAMVLHMLRAGMGDELFTRGAQLYLDRFRFKCAETDDFRRCMEEVSGQSLERFFDQWAYRPGLPRIEVDLGYNDATGALTVTVDQTQRIDRFNPAYEFRLPLLLKYEDGATEYVYIGVDTRSVRADFKIGLRPRDVSVDPNMTVVCAATIRKPLAMWLEELRAGPTLLAQVRAAEHLAGLELESPWITRSLAEAARDPRADVTVREAATAAVNARTLLALTDLLGTAGRRALAARTGLDRSGSAALVAAR